MVSELSAWKAFHVGPHCHFPSHWLHPGKRPAGIEPRDCLVSVAVPGIAGFETEKVVAFLCD